MSQTLSTAYTYKRKPKSHYELSSSQVETPLDVVDLFWVILKKYRATKFDNVVDFGAGDAKFSNSNFYDSYLGVEIDANEIIDNHKSSVEIINDCAFSITESHFDACVGNPPYVRHHDIESPWKEDTAKFLNKSLNFNLNLHSNLFAYFIALGVLKTKSEGLVAQIIPYEWVSRPSYKTLRQMIIENQWQVDIYCFDFPVFKTVLTTACITVIDKSKRNGLWNFYNIDEKLTISNRLGITGSGKKILEYSQPNFIKAKRGISPGSQKIFTLTEGERIHNRLSMSDVVPCVTTLKELPRDLQILNKHSFKKHFIEAGKKCWLVRSNENKLSDSLTNYLSSIPEELRNNYTCLNQHPWYNFEQYEVPRVLLHSGFVKIGPRVLVNGIGAVAVGSVMGINSHKRFQVKSLASFLRQYDFESRIVAHANNLKKIEVRQLNSVINEWIGYDEK